MNITVIEKPSRGKGQAKIFYTLAWGREKGQRSATGIFTYEHPKTPVQKNHNKEALLVLETKKSQMILDRQAIASGHIPAHNFKTNFLDFYEQFVKENKQANNRHVEGSLRHFKAFLRRNFISPTEITENLCERYRKYLLDNFNGDTPANYFLRFKRCIKSATKAGYFRINPADDIKSKSNKNFKRKEFLEQEEYIMLLKTPCLNEQLRDAFIFCCYTGLRWCDIKVFTWKNIRGNDIVFRVIQEKTTKEVIITMHKIAQQILEKYKKRFDALEPSKKAALAMKAIFKLPSQDMALRTLDAWCTTAGIQKHITWHSARLSFSILLQDQRVDPATVALLLGHETTEMVNRTYKRFRPKDQTGIIAKLPEYTTNYY